MEIMIPQEMPEALLLAAAVEELVLTAVVALVE